MNSRSYHDMSLNKMEWDASNALTPLGSIILSSVMRWWYTPNSVPTSNPPIPISSTTINPCRRNNRDASLNDPGPQLPLTLPLGPGCCLNLYLAQVQRASSLPRLKVSKLHPHMTQGQNPQGPRFCNLHWRFKIVWKRMGHKPVCSQSGPRLQHWMAASRFLTRDEIITMNDIK